ncbi:hypothetical protein [Paracoccus sp. SM22M-07]|uniref:hypothetical protein n=1 Tax=Paracoccus sp. SM22M-07 TaxID=1520813 RepID=UPI000B197C3D|nr:hypothetical protein [Paracoccus sp. SM22M-07]
MSHARRDPQAGDGLSANDPPTVIEVASASPLRYGSGIQMFVIHTGQNMGIRRTDGSYSVTKLHHG